MGTSKSFNSLFTNSFRAWLNQVITGSYIITYSTSIALQNISDEIKLV